MENYDSPYVDSSYPPWDTFEVVVYILFFLLLSNLIIPFVVSLLTYVIMGDLEWTRMMRNPQAQGRQLIFFINMTVSEAIFVILLYVRVCKFYALSLTEGFRITTPEDLKISHWIVIWALIIIPLIPVKFLPFVQPQINSTETAHFSLLYIGLFGITIVPLFEELTFRGFAFPALERLAGTWPAIIIVSIVFALSHVPQLWGNWGSIIKISCVGLGLTFLRAKTGSTLICIMVHYVHNLLVMSISLFGSRL